MTAVSGSDVRSGGPTPFRPDGGIDVLTADGAVIRIRPVSPADAGTLIDLHERASDDALYRRFLATGHHPIAGEVARLIRPPDIDHAALIAVEHGRAIGVCSYEVLPGRDSAEFAIFVDDGCHDRGIGTLLLEHLTVWCRRHGIPDLLGEVLPSNSPMLRMAAGLGQPTRSSFDSGLTHVHLDTSDAESDTIDIRDLAAARHSLSGLLAPHRVAVVTTESARRVTGDVIVRSILGAGFTGTVYAVNPDADTTAGAPAVASIFGVPGPVDLVIIDVPAADVAAVLADCVTAGARTAVVLSAGFAEAGPEGRTRQTELVRIARAGGMRLVGPNCLGVINTDPAVRLHAALAGPVRAGSIAVASQSGAVGISLLESADHAGVGIASFVSLGNKADISGNDLLSYWYDDPTVQVVALYLESLGNPRRFARIARAVARRKPVLVVKSGRSVVGMQAGFAHTAAAEASDRTVDALFAQAGVIRCDSLGEMFATARMLAGQPLANGDRIAIIGNAGGINVLCADAAATANLTVPTLPADAQDAIRSAAPDGTSTTNPVDLGTAGAAAICESIRAAASHVDAIVIAIAATLADSSDAIAAIGSAIDDLPIPVAVILLGSEQAPLTVGTRHAPVYRMPEEAISALGRAVRYGRWRAEPLRHRAEIVGIDAARARALVTEALATGDSQPASAVAAELVGCYGIPVTAAASAGVELAVTVAHDKLFGSIVTCGLGGVAGDLLDDRSLRLLPITDRDAEQMWRGLRSAPLLTGYRGSIPVDTTALEDLLVRIGRLAEDLPEVADLRLEPVFATPDGVAAGHVTLRIAAVGFEPDPAMRSLREPA
jgi:acyl-CoA synthetase (NDP forming)/GNAT superfamily N-acetyltransferase